MKVQCSHCEKKYTLPQERVAGRILKIRCRQCSELFEVDGSNIVLEMAEQQITNAVTNMPTGASNSINEAVPLRTQEYSALKLDQQNNEPSATPLPQQGGLSSLAQSQQLSQAQAAAQAVPQINPSLAQNQGQHINAELKVEVSQSAQDWMESVMSDVDRPITQELRVEEITGHHALPPEKKSSSGLIFATIALLIGGLVYTLTQVSNTPRDTPKTVTLNLEVKTSDKQEVVSASETKEDDKVEDQANTEQNQVAGSEQAQDVENTVSSQKNPTKKKKRVSSTKSEDLTNMKQLLTLKTDASQEKELKLEGSLSSAKRNTKQADKKRIKSKEKQDTLSLATAKKKKKSASSSKRSKSKKESAPKKSAKVKKRTTEKRASKRKLKKGKGLDRSTISSIMNQNAGGLQNCYRKTLKRDPSFGEVRTNLKFIVRSEGRVDRPSIQLSGVYRKTRLESCIQNTVVRWYFPKAKGDTPVRYPLNFRPGF